MSRRAILYIAVSLDGYIADVNGGIDFLEAVEDNAEQQQAYQSFLQGIDTVMMGRRTYDQIKTELSPAQWPYEGLQSYVFTSHALLPDDACVFLSEAPESVLCRLKKQRGKDIWILGGAAMAKPLITGNFIDEYQITWIPVLLGDGVPLFEKGSFCPIALRLKSVTAIGGGVFAVYQRDKQSENTI